MKCVHCSAWVERGEWFCPNCKRSARSERPRLGRPGATSLYALTAACSLVLGSVAGGRLWASRPPVAQPGRETPVVRVVTLTGAAPARYAQPPLAAAPARR